MLFSPILFTAILLLLFPFSYSFYSKTFKVSVSSVSNFPPSILSWTHSNPRFYLQLSEDMALIKVLKTSALLSQRSFLSSHLAQPIISIVHTHCVLFETVFLHWAFKTLTLFGFIPTSLTTPLHLSFMFFLISALESPGLVLEPCLFSIYAYSVEKLIQSQGSKRLYFQPFSVP